MPTAVKSKSAKSNTRSKENVVDFKGLRSTEKQIISRLIESSFGRNSKSLSREKSALIMNNFPLAIHMAKKYLRTDTDIQDLIQVAAIGLIKAVKRYKTSAKSKLSYYAIPTIEGELKHYMRDNFYSIRASRKYSELNSRIQKARELFLYENGREITSLELSRRLHISLKEISKASEEMKAHYTVSLDEPMGVINKSKMNNQLRLEEMISRTSNIDKMIDIEGVNQAMQVLAERDRKIIKDRLVREMGQTELADKYNLTQAQISRIIQASCEKMYAALV